MQLSADGEVVWSRSPDAGIKLTGDRSVGEGGKKARFARESTKETVKTIARGKPDRSGWTCGWLRSRVFYARPRVQPASGFPCALGFLEGHDL